MSESNPDELVRVKYDNGSEVTLTRLVAEKHGYKILDKQAADLRGTALSDKPQLKLGVTVTGTGKEGAVVKADLVAALQTNDATRV